MEDIEKAFPGLLDDPRAGSSRPMKRGRGVYPESDGGCCEGEGGGI
jgi:hypothetical protein